MYVKSSSGTIALFTPVLIAPSVSLARSFGWMLIARSRTSTSPWLMPSPGDAACDSDGIATKVAATAAAVTQVRIVLCMVRTPKEWFPFSM